MTDIQSLQQFTQAVYYAELTVILIGLITLIAIVIYMGRDK